jgi:hypothetical protein
MTDEERAHARIEDALGQIGTDVSAPAGWEARVLAEVHARPRRRAWWKLVVPALAAGVAVAAAVVIVPRLFRSSERVELAFDVHSERSGPAVRANDVVNLGDVVTATATGGKKYRAVWIYREDRKLFECPGDERCSETRDALIAKVKIDLTGMYTLMALSSSEPLPVATTSLDEAMAAVQRAGVDKRVERRRVQ